MDQTRNLKGEVNLLRVGIDIGGTFTDFVVYDSRFETLNAFKLPSTPGRPDEAVIQGLSKVYKELISGQVASIELIHGSTVATNALLERKGAKTAFIATQGFGDILQIGRQNRPDLYNLLFEPLPALVPDKLRLEVIERVDRHGKVLQGLDLNQLEQQMAFLKASNVEAVAVCLLFSFLHPEHERLIGDRLRQEGFFVSLSSEVLPEFREYERASTTTVNAYVSPRLADYLNRLELELIRSSIPTYIRVMQSNGGNLSLDKARHMGVHCILSGPAGGVVGARTIAQISSRKSDEKIFGGGTLQKLITFDMGGTSTDVSLIDGSPKLTTEAEVSGCPIRIPMLDIHTIGAGGGSIARLDTGGALRVGPESAGAYPGPACYGNAKLPTVTDANLILGRLVADYFLGGEMPLNQEMANDAMAELGRASGMQTDHVALGVIEVVNAHMERALRLISVERGYDPREFTLLSFGGAGGLHAADLARRLGIPFVLIPPLASTLSAFGMLATDLIKDYSQTVMVAGDTAYDRIEELFQPLAQQAIADISEEELDRTGSGAPTIQFEKFVDLRYAGQSYELRVPYSKQFLGDFHEQHRHAYGYANPQAKVELVNLRLQAVVKVQGPILSPGKTLGPDPSPACLGNRPVTLRRNLKPEVPFYWGERLTPGNRLSGPAIVVRKDTTILLGIGDEGQVDGYGNLWIKVGASHGAAL